MSFDKELALRLCRFSERSYSQLTFQNKNDGFLLVRDLEGNQILGFPGSDQTGDWISDFEFVKVKRHGLGDVHNGFSDCWDILKEEVMKRLDKKIPIYVTGHSYGGAVATLASLSLFNEGYKIKSVYTYGGPRVGNKDWFNNFKKSGIELFRVKNGNDIVTRIPKLFYYHVGQEVQINNRSWFSWLHNNFIDHPIGNYITELERNLKRK